MIGKSIWHYRIVEKLGVDMCEVCRAEDTTRCRHVAIKFLPDHFDQM